MNLPVSVEDPSLLEHEPLRTRITTFECAEGQRSATKQSVSEFVQEMQQDGCGQVRTRNVSLRFGISTTLPQAAVKEWATLVFQGILSNGRSFKVIDRGEELYKVFFEYQYRLYKGRKAGNMDETRQYEARVYRSGLEFINAVEARHDGASIQHSTRGSGNGIRAKDQDQERSSRSSGPKKADHQVETLAHRPDAGMTLFPVIAAACSDLISTGDAACSSLGRGTRSAKGSPAIPQESPFDPPPTTGGRPSTLSEVAKPSKRSTAKREKKKKRKASSQKPPVIASSDSSENDREPSMTHAATAANSISHRPKRIASNPRQPPDLPVVRNQTDKISSAHRATTTKQHSKGITSISQPQSSLINAQFVSRSSVQGRRAAAFPPSVRNRAREKRSNVSTRPTRTGSDTRKLRKKKLVRDPQPPANKRMRRASMSILENGPEEEPEPTYHLQTELPREPTIRSPLVTAPPLTKNVKRKARQKRTRLEFETVFVASGDAASANSHESLGPDNRLLRPLPRKKVCNARLAPAPREALCGAPSLEDAHQHLRDVATNGLAVLQEGVGPDIPDWTQDKEHDAERDDLGGDDQDERNDVEVNTAASVPNKPPLPVPPRMWAQVSCFILSQNIAIAH